MIRKKYTILVLEQALGFQFFDHLGQQGIVEGLAHHLEPGVHVQHGVDDAEELLRGRTKELPHLDVAFVAALEIDDFLVSSLLEFGIFVELDLGLLGVIRT